jgi:hypothetical protein
MMPTSAVTEEEACPHAVPDQQVPLPRQQHALKLQGRQPPIADRFGWHTV